MNGNLPATLQEAVVYFSNEDNAFQFVKSMRWTDGVAVCPVCKSTESYELAGRLWKCKGCAKKFSVRVGTIFEDSPLSLSKWMCGFWLIVNAKNGISSCEIHRALGITQKSAWFMLHRIRLAMQNGTIVKMAGTVEADESFVGGNADFMHKSEKKKKGIGRGYTNKTIVMGLLEHGKEKGKSRITAKVVKNTAKKTLKQQIDANVEAGSTLHTDAWIAYRSLGADYIHKFVDHAVEYVRDGVHTNGLENFWTLLKRALKGTYVAVNAEHLFRYLDEQTYRFNTRSLTDGERFVAAVARFAGKRLTYAKLISEGGDCLPATV